jgi:hypothetical protein
VVNPGQSQHAGRREQNRRPAMVGRRQRRTCAGTHLQSARDNDRIGMFGDKVVDKQAVKRTLLHIIEG